MSNYFNQKFNVNTRNAKHNLILPQVKASIAKNAFKCSAATVEAGTISPGIVKVAQLIRRRGFAEN